MVLLIMFSHLGRVVVLSDPEFARDTSNLTRPYRYFGASDIDYFHDLKLKWEATKTYVRGLWCQAVASFPRF